MEKLAGSDQQSQSRLRHEFLASLVQRIRDLAVVLGQFGHKRVKLEVLGKESSPRLGAWNVENEVHRNRSDIREPG